MVVKGGLRVDGGPWAGLYDLRRASREPGETGEMEVMWSGQLKFRRAASSSSMPPPQLKTSWLDGMRDSGRRKKRRCKGRSAS